MLETLEHLAALVVDLRDERQRQSVIDPEVDARGVIARYADRLSRLGVVGGRPAQIPIRMEKGRDGDVEALLDVPKGLAAQQRVRGHRLRRGDANAPAIPAPDDR